MRILKLLQQAGVDTETIHAPDSRPADSLIALHATKTLAISRAYKAANPHGKLVIFLTGTDLYRELPANNPQFFEALDLADTLVVAQQASLASIPTLYQTKAQVVHKSIILPMEVSVPVPPRPSLALISHLRPVKNPFLLNRALSQIPEIPLHAYTLGEALTPKSLQHAQQWEKKDSRFHWLGGVPYAETISWIRQATLTINTSLLEGGANSIGESVMLSTPVLATDIEGNRGMLGDDYDGYFPSDSPQALAELILVCLEEPTFLQHLTQQIIQRHAHFCPQRETEDWLKTI